MWWVAQALEEHGFDVGIITSGMRSAQPMEFGNPLRRWYREAGRIPVLHVPAYRRYDATALRRITALVSFAATSTTLAQPSIEKADVCLVYGSPATAVAPALAANLRTGVPYVMYIQDLWPDSIFATGYLTGGVRARVVKSVFGPFLALAYRRAAHIIAITPGMRQTLIDRGVPGEKITVIYNWVDEDVLSPRPPSRKLRDLLGIADEDFVLLYAGNHGPGQALDNVIRAVVRNGPAQGLHLVLLGAGSQRENLRALVAELGGEDVVHFMDAVPSDDVAEYTAGADACLVSLADEPVFDVTLPSKSQSALAQGKPVLAVGRGDLVALVDESGAGWTCPPGDPEALSAVLTEMAQTDAARLAARGAAGLAYYKAHLSHAIGAQKLADVMHLAMDTAGSDAGA